MRNKKPVILTVLATYAALCALSALCAFLLIPESSKGSFIISAVIYSVMLAVPSSVIASKGLNNILTAYLSTVTVVFTFFSAFYYIFDRVSIDILRNVADIMTMVFGFPSLMLLMSGYEGGIMLFLLVAAIPIIPVLTSLIIKRKELKSMKKEYKSAIIGIAAVAAVILICLVSFDNFRTFNPVKAGISFARLQLTDTEYTEVKKSPRVILTKSENGKEIFAEIIEGEGYEYIEQNGAGHIIEKDGKQETVVSHMNKYFTRWEW